MKNEQNLTIALLLATAMILTALLITSYQNPNTAYANTTMKDGDFILGTGALTSTTDLIYIVDIGAKRLNVYFTDNNTGTMDLADSVDLERAFTTGQ